MGYAHVNGRRTVYVPVTKRPDASTLNVIHSVKAALPQMRAVANSVGPDVQIDFVFDQSPYVVNAITGLIREGLLGALLTGVFASSAINPIFKDSAGNPVASGLLEGNAHQLLNQAVGVIIAWGLAIVGTLIILKVVDAVIGLRVADEHEVQGLDLSQHGERAFS